MHEDFLLELIKSRKAKQKLLLKSCNNSELKTVVECIENSKHISFSKPEKRSIKPLYEYLKKDILDKENLRKTLTSNVNAVVLIVCGIFKFAIDQSLFCTLRDG
jgi:hypothetical protein